MTISTLPSNSLLAESSNPKRLIGKPAWAPQGDKRPLSVGVLVDLEQGMKAGGHVKCWQRFAEAATALPDQLDLTIHFLGGQEGMRELSENVRLVTHRPVFGTDRFRFLDKIPGQTDLAPRNAKLFSFLKNYDVIHTTDAFFTLSKTARFFARRFSRPLVNSIHTDIPAYTQIFTAQVVRRLAGNGYFSRFLLDRVRVHDFAAAFMHQRLIAYLKRCDWVLISKKNELNRFKSELPGGQVSLLRRGIDKEAFHPRRREPSLLRSSFGIAPDRFLLLFVGRIDAAKGVMTLAHAARLLLQKGLPVHVLMAGQGTQKEAVQELLGGAVTFSGALPQARLPLLYASSDLFVFPSETEECPNVVLEAKASGLPVLLSTRGGSAQLVKQEGRDGLLIEGSKPASWAGAIEFLMKDPEHLHRMREAARRIMELEWPSWQEVLEEDLLPVWQKVSQGATRSGRTKPGDRNISKMLSEIQ